MEGAVPAPLFLLFMVFSSFLLVLLVFVSLSAPPPLMLVGVVMVARLGRCSA